MLFVFNGLRKTCGSASNPFRVDTAARVSKKLCHAFCDFRYDPLALAFGREGAVINPSSALVSYISELHLARQLKHSPHIAASRLL